MYEPRETDATYQRLALTIFNHLKSGNVVLMKWTCPGCGERVTSTDPITLVMHEGRQVAAFPPGFVHSEKEDGSPCGESVDIRKYRFGFMLIMGAPTDNLAWLKNL